MTNTDGAMASNAMDNAAEATNATDANATNAM
jgi:hypothetical protein